MRELTKYEVNEIGGGFPPLTLLFAGGVIAGFATNTAGRMIEWGIDAVSDLFNDSSS